MRTYTALDTVIINLANTVSTFCEKPRAARVYPGEVTDPADFSAAERDMSSRYMRINHVGEICAQALYQSQALTSRSPEIRQKMKQASEEEIDHLAWCEERLEELGGRKSYLNPFWYAGSFAIGTAAGLAGDKWNLGFVAETEKQVVQHLDGHLGKLPKSDLRSREIVAQMKDDEAKHAEEATEAGAAELPPPIKSLMKIASGVMTRTAYWI